MTANARAEKFDVYQAVTDTIVAALEAALADTANHIPWRKPWVAGDGVNCNATTRKPYRGINQLLLSLSPFASPHWMTAKQAFAAGASIKPDQARKNGGPGPTMVVFWKQSRYNCKPTDQGAKIDPKTGRWVRESFIARAYNVWNTDQLDDVPEKLLPPEPAEQDTLPRLDDCQRVLDGFSADHAVPITEGGAHALYAPALDMIQLPPLDTFASSAAFYATGFHECVHATGHESRLARPGVVDMDAFGTDQYGKEELVAEIGASIVCALLRIDAPDLDENRDAYIASWLKTIKGDPKLVVGAAAQAQKAADMVIGDRYADLVDITEWTTNDTEGAVAA